MAKFRTKARAIELLGKGQIADLPTAISELWKNGYDAYANDLSCGLYLEDYKGNNKPIFTLSDDGFGMNRSDLENKWIVLGTDSKARGKSILSEVERLGKPPRIPMGEKGIGRLSVAYLGPQMLMLTKKKNEKCQALFIDWRVLENYHLFIDDLEVPIEEFSSLNEFDSMFKKMKKVFNSNLQPNLWPEQHELLETIKDDLELIKMPQFILDEKIVNFTQNDVCGTCFVIFQPHEQILELTDFIDSTQKDKSTIIEFRKSLSGLYNEFKGDRKFETNFHVYNEIGKYNLINDFFTPEDLKKTDHCIKGKFDEYGFFEGEVRVYDKIVKHTFKPTRKPGNTPYGPFEIELGVLEGNLKSSKLTEEMYRDLDKRTASFGGLYIYRDDFRVLPYGRTEYDFLEFEQRRSKSAGYYFFSQRNMLGYISISRNKNKKLTDKAGREGFIANQAYREFKDDLINFFKDLSLSYFKSTGNEEETNLRNDQLQEISQRKVKLLAEEKKKSKLTLRNFTKELKNNQEKMEVIQNEIDSLYNKLSEFSSKSEIQYNDYEKLSSDLEKKKHELRKLKMKEPKRFKLSSVQENRLNRFFESYKEVSLKAENCTTIVIDTRSKFDYQNLKNEYIKKYDRSIRDLSVLFNTYKNMLSDSSNKLMYSLNEEKSACLDNFKEQLQQFDISNLEHKEELSEALEELDLLKEEFHYAIVERFKSFIDHVGNLNFDIDDDFLVGWYKEQNKKLEEKMQMTNELAQLGMSVEIIDHQFNVMYSHMADSIDFFKQFTNEKPEIHYQYKQLKSAFQHLESNHKLLTPLFRTTRRNKSIIKGSSIEEFLNNFFRTIFIKNNITLTSDDSFKNYEYFTFESIIKPVFVNIVNNAIFWLTSTSERKIHMTIMDKNVLILNNGERIEDRYLEDIFTLFFSKRREGRGIGLYLARTNLRSIGHDILATNDKKYNTLDGACFIINRKEQNYEF